MNDLLFARCSTHNSVRNLLHVLSHLSARFYQFLSCFLIGRLRKLFLFRSSYLTENTIWHFYCVYMLDAQLCLRPQLVPHREHNLAFLLRVYARSSTVFSVSTRTSQRTQSGISITCICSMLNCLFELNSYQTENTIWHLYYVCMLDAQLCLRPHLVPHRLAECESLIYI